MENTEHHLWYNVFRRNQVDVVYLSYVLQLYVPVAQLFWGQILTIPLMCDIVVLAEYASKIAAGEEYGTTAVVALYTGFC